MKRILVTICVLFAIAISAFADEVQYKTLLEEAKNYEANEQWVYAMGTYWDACSAYPEGAKEAYDGFNRIAAGFSKIEYGPWDSERNAGNPGPGEYDIFTRYDGWIKVCKEFEIYWNEHSDEILYVPGVECEKGEADMKNRTVTYKFKADVEQTPKFLTISSCILDSFRAAYQDNWDEIPVQWPAVSMFKDSKTIPVVKFISIYNDKQYNGKIYGRELFYLDNFVHTKIKKNILSFPPLEQKVYYVAAWNNKCSIDTKGEPESNLEIKIQITDREGTLIGSVTSTNSTFAISGISSDYMKILDSGNWKYEIKSIVTKSKSESGKVANDPDERRWSSNLLLSNINYINGPIIDMYKAKRHNNALIEVEAAPLVKTMFAKCKLEKDIHEIQIRTSKVRNNYNGLDTLPVKDELFVIPFLDNAKLRRDYGPDVIVFGNKEFGVDDILELMNKMYDSKFYLGYNSETKLNCIYSISETDEIKKILVAREEEENARKKAMEEEYILKKYPQLNSIIIDRELKEVNLADFPSIVSYINMMIAKNEGYSLRDEVFSFEIVCDYKTEKSKIAAMLENLGESVRKADFYVNLELSYFTKDIDCLYLKNCNKLVKVHALYAGRIPENAFSGCTSLEEINIFSADYIEKNAFADCPALKELWLHDNNYIDKNAFDGCEHVKKIWVPKNLKKVLKENYKDLIKAGVMYFMQ